MKAAVINDATHSKALCVARQAASTSEFWNPFQEYADMYIYSSPMPGLRQDKLRVSANREWLHVEWGEGERHGFRHSFFMPGDVHVNGVQAAYENDRLWVVLPRLNGRNRTTR